MKKKILLTIMSLSIFACTTNNSPSINTTIEKFDTEKGSSYSFKIRATLTEADLVADLNNLRKKNNSLVLVNRIVFYKTNYPALFASAMTNNPSLQSALKWNSGVMAMMKKDVPFSNFVNNVSPTATPTPSATPTATPTPLATPTPTITPPPSCPPGMMGMPPACTPMIMPCSFPGSNIPPGCVG